MKARQRRIACAAPVPLACTLAPAARAAERPDRQLGRRIVASVSSLRNHGGVSLCR